MPKVYAFYNPLAGKGSCQDDVHFLDLIYDDPILYCDLTKPETYEHQLFTLQKEDILLLCGGDGTLQRFFNVVPYDTVPCDIFYFPLGCENNFSRSLFKPFGCAPYSIRPYLQRLPKMSVGRRQICFFHSIEWKSPKHLDVTVSVDGEKSTFKRLQAIRLLHDPNRQQLQLQLAGRCRFLPVKINPKQALTLCGNEISIQFPQTTTLLLDGDPIADITGYTATLGTR